MYARFNLLCRIKIDLLQLATSSKEEKILWSLDTKCLQRSNHRNPITKARLVITNWQIIRQSQNHLKPHRHKKAHLETSQWELKTSPNKQYLQVRRNQLSATFKWTRIIMPSKKPHKLNKQFRLEEELLEIIRWMVMVNRVKLTININNLRK